MASSSMSSNLILAAVAAMMLLLTGAFSLSLEALAQVQKPQQQKLLIQSSSSTATTDIRSKATDIENTVKSALKSYATAIDVRYMELDSFNRTQIPPATSNNTGVAPLVVNQTAYADTQNLIAKAENQLQSLSQIANLQQADLIAKVQIGLTALKNLIDRKAPYDLLEDVVESPIMNNLGQLS
jgi:hypothetical protein